MLRELESIKKDIGEVVMGTSIHDTRRDTLLDVIEKIDVLMEHLSTMGDDLHQCSGHR